MLRRFNKNNFWLISFVVFFITLVSQMGFALECKNVNLITTLYLRNHMSNNKFDDSISERTLKNFVKAWDPGKVYFLKSDVDSIMAKYGSILPGMLAKADCSPIDEIFKVYFQRFVENYKLVSELIEFKHNFKIDEYLNIDRKSVDYAANAAELKERWRQRVKFQHMQLLNTLSKGMKNKDKEVRAKLHKRYDLLVKRNKEVNSTEVYEVFLNSFSTALDPHSEYFTPSQLEEFHIRTRLFLEGIGALLRSEDGITSIQGLVPGGSAQKSGLLKVGDKIVAVAQDGALPVEVIDMDLKDVVKLIRGPRATKVILSIRRGMKEFMAVLTREKVDLPDQAAKSRVYEVKADLAKAAANNTEAGQAETSKTYKIGVIDLPSFYLDFEARSAKQKNVRSSTHDVGLEIKKMQEQNVDSIIVDIRSNGGGALDEAIDVSGLFLGAGPIVQVKKGNDKPYINHSRGDAAYNGPLIVMINQQSASASEIMAGAIQDYGRGLIIGGAHTFGKGTVQNVDNLDAALGAIKVTISEFYRAAGSSTQMKGVLSDIVLPAVSELYEIGEKFYDYALPWDSVPAASHKDFNMTKPYLAALASASGSRIKEDKEFAKVFEAMKEYKEKEKEHYKISLKLDGKQKPAKDVDEEAELERENGSIPKLSEDLHMQETLKIAVDYVRLLNKQQLVSLNIPTLEKEKLEKEKLEKEKKAALDKSKSLKKKKGSKLKAPVDSSLPTSPAPLEKVPTTQAAPSPEISK